MWEIELRHDGLNKYQIIRGRDQWVVEQRAAALRAQWNEAWAKKQAREQHFSHIWSSKEKAAQETEAAVAVLQSLREVLPRTLGQSYSLDWNSLKTSAPFSEPAPPTFVPTAAPEEPREPTRRQPVLTFLETLIPPMKKAAERRADAAYTAAREEFIAQCADWENEKVRVARENQDGSTEYDRALRSWKERQEKYLRDQADHNESIDTFAAAATEGREIAVKTKLEIAIGRAELPEPLSSDFELDYSETTKSAVIDFILPSPDQFPTEKEFRYIQARNEIVTKHISESEKSKSYDDLLYQLALRTLFVAFSADEYGHVQRVTFNGWVDYIHKATGMDERSCILSVAANRADFDRIDLQRVDAKECFKALKGVAASKLIGLAPVAPLERPTLVDSRFVASQDVANNLEAGINVAAMDWQDFEHLVRQVFENEFASGNTEVRVTQASRDGGVDAIVFDPDPIKGGKIVIQAKRYTNTVDVGSVRDLYGTVLNEGASKGILVTTSQFGPDARKFAQGKPLTLIDGGNFLFLLERMGVKARIDLKEAKAALAAMV